jgi:DNA adenine methylase
MHPLLRTYGGKFLIHGKIINLMPDCIKYVEPFCGGCSVLLNRPKAREELANDLDKELIRFYRTVQSQWEPLIRFLKGYPFCEDSFNDAPHLIASADPVESAAGYLVRNRMSYGGLGENYTWSEVPRRGVPRFQATWETVLRETLPQFARRIQNVLFLNQPAIKLIEQIGGPETLFYAQGSFWRCPNIDDSLDRLSGEEIVAFYEFFLGTLDRAVERVAKHFHG